MTLLVVAGEGSGDAFAAPVLRALSVPAFGMGGPALRAAGLDAVADIRHLSAMGLTAVGHRSLGLASALARLVSAVKERRPRAALLSGFSEPNAWLAGWMKGRGVRSLWYAPPQVWAWRPGRTASIARACDVLALLLPFEEPLWRRAGAKAHYVGHPAAWLEPADLTAPGGGAPRLALLPGSRDHEVRQHLSPMLRAAARLGLPARLILAPSLGEDQRARATLAARRKGVEVTSQPLRDALRGTTLAFACSGTATLECVALGVPPLIVYRTDALTFAVARRLVRVAHVGLPNLVLGRRAFPELLQDQVSLPELCRTAQTMLASLPELQGACDEVRRHLRATPSSRPPSDRVAELLRPWLA